MSSPKFPVGAEVRVKPHDHTDYKHRDPVPLGLHGKTGRVVGHDFSLRDPVMVDFGLDYEDHEGLHELDGRLQNFTGRYIADELLELVNPEFNIALPDNLKSVDDAIAVAEKLSTFLGQPVKVINA